MTTVKNYRLPPGQQLAAPGKWPFVGEKEPRSDLSPWTVSVCGAVDTPRTWSIDDLQQLPQTDLVVDIHCVTRWSILGAKFRGVLLKELLDRANVRATGKFVSFVARSDRRHSTSLPLADAVRLGTLVVLEADGMPLSQSHGGPVRTVVPDRYFYKSLKWLEQIEVLEADRLGYWEAEAGYHNSADPWQEQRYLGSGSSVPDVVALLKLRNLDGQELLSLKAAHHDLRGLSARNSRLRNAQFSFAKLDSADFTGANLSNAHFRNASLKDACFNGADLEGADFRGADLSGADLTGVSLLGATFVDESGDSSTARS